MAKIRGITIELGADASGLQKALKGIDSQLKTTQSSLKDVNRLLKLDPGNVELLTQKQKYLKDAIGLTKDRIEELKKAQSGLEKGSNEWNAIEREIVANEQQLKSLEKEYKQFGSVASQWIKAVGKKMQELGGKIEAAGKKLAPVSGAASAVGGALLKLGYDAVTGADDLNTMAKQTGLTTEQLQKMKYASDLVDVSVEDIAGAMKKLKPKIDPTNTALSDLGVAVQDADGNLRDANDVFFDTLEALSKIENETERDQKSMEIFGKSADSLAGIIDDGGEGLKQYGDEAQRLGLILDQETIDALNETNDTIDKVKMQLGGTMAKIGADVGSILAPALEKGASLIGKITEKLRQLTPEQTETILKIVGIVAAIAPVLIVGGKIISGLGTAISLIGTVVGVLGGPLTIAIGAVIAAGVLLYKNWDTIKATAQKLAVDVKTAFNNAKTGVVAAWTTMKTKVNSTIDSVKAKIDTLKSKIETLKTNFQTALEKVKEFFNFEFKLPDIKLPHFKVEGGKAPWGFGGEGQLPKITVDWYRRAYDNPVMFTSPTVLQTAAGYKGFGDGHGAEIVMGLNKLRELVGTAGNTINVYAAPGQSAKEIADEVQRVLVAQQRQRSRAYA